MFIPIPGTINICFSSTTHGIARRYNDATFNSDIVETNDGGATWSSTFNPVGSFFGADVKHVPGTNSMLVSTGVSISTGFTGSSYSTDGGHHWKTIDTGTQRNALGIADSLTMWSGGFTTNSTSNGIFKFEIFGGVACSDPAVSAGISSADDTIVCGSDSVTFTSTGVVSPVIGSYSGFSWIISRADISGSLDPLNESSFLTTYRVTFPAPATNSILFINDRGFINGINYPFGIYYWTPVVFGNATPVSMPVMFLIDLTLDLGCVHTGKSIPVFVANPNQPCLYNAQAPTSPTNLIASGTTATTTSLNWTASTDNISVTGYDVYKNNVFLITVPTNSYTVPGLTPMTNYTFFVKARNFAGNISGPSNTINVTTLCNSFNAISVSISANPSGNVCPETNVIFNAVPVNPGTNPIYQWQKNGTNVGINSNTYSDNSLSTGSAIKCILTSNIQCPSGNPATSNTITKNVSFFDDNNPCTSEGCLTSTGVTTHILLNTDDNNQCTLDGCNSESSSNLLFVDDFNFSGTLTANGWIPYSSSGVKPISTTTGLLYNGFPGSTIGNATLMDNIGGEDDHIIYNGQNTDGQNIFYSLILKVTDPSSSKTGDYIVHLGKCTGGCTTVPGMAARLWIRIVSNNVNFGITNFNFITNYGATNFSKNTTYLLIVKYSINTIGNDAISIWVFPSGVPATEVSAGIALSTQTGQAGLDSLNEIGLRQGSSLTSVQTIIDGIRVGTTWASVTANLGPGGVFHTPINSDDNNVCTIDGCNTNTGLFHNLVNTDDNNLCTSDACNSITGLSHAEISMDDNNVCTIDACDPITGISHTIINIDDNDVCTSDACNSITGLSHTSISKDDNNVCTTDACDPITGISHTIINIDDKNVCTTDACDSITGISHTIINIDDNDVCTSDACDPITGISHTIINIDDNDVCTSDACDSITGLSHAAISIDDNNVCTIDACDPITGISHTIINIDDNDVCTSDDCDPITGISHTIINIDDNDVCTSDACNPITGISHTIINIDDNDVCTVDACDPITGLSHTAISMDDNNVCTTDACDPITGIFHTIINIDDNNVCTIDDCDIVSGISHTELEVSDNNACTNDGCNSLDGIYHHAINIDDQNNCTVDICDPATGIITHTDSKPLITISADPILCYGGTTCITIQATGDFPPYAGTGTFCGYGDGTYTFEITDSRGCISTSPPVEITEPLKLSITTSSTPSSGPPDGTATAIVSGGTPDYSYVWTPGGQTTAVSTGLSSGNYCVEVTDANGCTATSCVVIFVIDICDLHAPGTISGPKGICKKQTGIVYCVTIPPLFATNYVWTLPPGVSFTGASDGPCITLKFSSKFKGGYICAKANLWCGTTANACINVVLITKKPNTPGIISGPSSLCPNQNSTYSIASVTNASDYLWKVDGRMSIISGQGTTSVTIHTASDFNEGLVKVQANNCFDHSGTKKKNITKNLNCKVAHNSVATELNNSDLFSAYPNPTSGILTVSFQTKIKSAGTIMLIDLLGNVLMSKIIITDNNKNRKDIDLSNVAHGMYFLTLEIEGTKVYFVRLVVD